MHLRYDSAVDLYKSISDFLRRPYMDAVEDYENVDLVFNECEVSIKPASFESIAHLMPFYLNKELLAHLQSI